MLGEVLTAWRIGGIALVFLGILTICKVLKISGRPDRGCDSAYLLK